MQPGLVVEEDGLEGNTSQLISIIIILMKTLTWDLANSKSNDTIAIVSVLTVESDSKDASE